MVKQYEYGHNVFTLSILLADMPKICANVIACRPFIEYVSKV